jgi:hypothetical protein
MIRQTVKIGEGVGSRYELIAFGRVVISGDDLEKVLDRLVFERTQGNCSESFIIDSKTGRYITLGVG